jgi:hypothetical protein
MGTQNCVSKLKLSFEVDGRWVKLIVVERNDKEA